MEDKKIISLNFELYESGNTILDMEGSNQDLLVGISAILSKMIMETDAPRKEVTKVFLQQIKKDINNIIDSNAWEDDLGKEDNVIQLEKFKK